MDWESLGPLGVFLGVVYEGTTKALQRAINAGKL